MAAAVRSISTSGLRLVRTIAAPAAARVISTDPPTSTSIQMSSLTARSTSVRGCPTARYKPSSTRTITIRQRS
jgi:hypothetical protein